MQRKAQPLISSQHSQTEKGPKGTHQQTLGSMKLFIGRLLSSEAMLFIAAVICDSYVAMSQVPVRRFAEYE
jgi:hypothetical protein